MDMSDDIERRTFALELRIKGDTDPVIEGYGALFNSESQDLGGFREKIAPGAFARTIKNNKDIMSLFNHDPSMVLGRTGNGTLTLREDKTGLHMEVRPPNTAAARDVIEVIRRGDVTGQSFQFVTVRDSWEGMAADQDTIRTLEEVRLLEVGPVVFPAYTDTKVSARALEMGAPHSAEPDPEPPAEPSDPPQGETPEHSEAVTDPPEQHSVTPRPLSNLAKEWRMEVEAGL
jgi:HK97 family phage prohead protease